MDTEFVSVRAEYLLGVHYLYFFVSIISFAFAFLSFGMPVIAGFLFLVTFLNLFMSWVAFESVYRFFKYEDDSDFVNYLLLLFIALFLVFALLYVGVVLFDTAQQWVIVVSYFLFFWGFGSYVLTRVEVVGDIFRIVRLTKYHFGISKIASIFTNPAYESIVDVLNLIESRLVKFYEPGSDGEIDELLLKVADESDVPKLRKLIVDLGIALYGYEMSELVHEQDENDEVDNSGIIRRFGYKKKMLEIIRD